MDDRELLEYIFRGGGKQIVSTLPEGVHKQFDAKDVDAAWEYIVEQGKTSNVYINPNGRREDLPNGVRGGDDDVRKVIALAVDADVLGAAHKEQNLPPTKQDAIDALNELPIPPSVIVDSGYGIYGYYLFESPIDTTDEKTRRHVAAIYKGFGKSVTKAFAEKVWKIDQVFNLSHCFRAPGSLNHKLNNEKPECRVIVDNGIFYTLEDFEKFYEEPVVEHTAFEVDERVVGSADRILEGCAFIRKLVDNPRGMIGKINQLGDNSGLGLLIHSIDENGTYWQINSVLYREFVIRKFDLFDGAVIKSVSEAKTETQLKNTYIQNNYYTVNNNFFNPDNALEALMDLKRLAVNQATIALPDSRLMKSAVQQLPFQQRGWDALDDNQKEEQATAYANRIFDSGDFKADTLSETQMRRFFLTQGILDNLTDISRGNLISAIQVYDLLQFCVDKFGLNMLNSESARGILFAKLYEAILKESLKPALASVDEIAGMKLKFNMNTEYLLSDAPADIMTMGNFEFILRKSFCRQALANVCTFNLGREEKDVQWWYNHHSDIDAITHLRNDCCHSGNHFGPDKLDELIKLLFEMGVIANVELYNDIAGRIIL